MKEIFYIGCFPPPYGGATIKNMVIYDELIKRFDISKFDTSIHKNSLFMIFELLSFLSKNKNKKGIISISSKSLFKLTKVISLFDKSMLENISVFVLGGIFDTYVKQRNEKASLYNRYKVMYVESPRMKTNLDSMGFNNVRAIPNFRTVPAVREFKKLPDGRNLKCAFISKICEDKGVDVILKSDKILKSKGVDYSVDFYGHIDRGFEEYFLHSVETSSNLFYKGVIKYENENTILDVLKNYDVLLFPTRYHGEGIPGILVEAKLVGVAPIASMWNYNDELVNNGVDGLIMEENTPERLSDAIIKLINERDYLNFLRSNSYMSGEKYLITNYIDEIIEGM